jgi:hypothetical protein
MPKSLRAKTHPVDGPDPSLNLLVLGQLQSNPLFLLDQYNA